MKRFLLLGCIAWPFTTTSEASTRRLLHFSDVHLNLSTSFSSTENARIPIRYFADAPLALFESALRYAKKHVVEKPELFLYTGDHVVHGEFTDPYVAHVVATNVETMEKYYPVHNTTGEVTAILGNADANPDYHMEVTNQEIETNPSIELISKVWEDSLSVSNMDLLNRRGYLSYPLDPKLDVITLNTVPYSPHHVPDTSHELDPFGQFAWLKKTLAKLRDAGKFAFLAGHIPPIVDSYGGDPQWHTKYIVEYKKIVGHYADVIKAQLFGHVHSVEFRVPVTSLESAIDNGNAFQLPPMYISGSISPLFGNNPSFILWEYDHETYEMVDYTVYASNIKEVAPQLEWKVLFKASEAYGLTSLARTELAAFLRRAQQNGSVVEVYHWNTKARSPHAQPCKDVICHAKTVCTLVWWTTKSEFLACVQASIAGIRTETMMGSTADVATVLSGAYVAPNDFTTTDVVLTMGTTLLASTAVLICVVLTVYALKRSGVVKNRDLYETMATL
ncbi:hypothetical protein PsorP6_009257 [Peronosclerospora sorghi]|uniref:Uncharacterized protein n=1 Tax=Peronosclerospora sorghi TaxID=230839 RepID=A0ACC0W332_9STRA|nr:hypothetical protein PsorP6_009257 [Peronosclerospora sorghi]